MVSSIGGCKIDLDSITIDNKTLEDNTVTVRDRDTMKQIRVEINDLCTTLRKFLDGEALKNLGKIINP